MSETKKRKYDFETATLKRHSRGYVEVLLFFEKGIHKPFEKSIDCLTATYCCLSMREIEFKYYKTET